MNASFVFFNYLVSTINFLFINYPCYAFQKEVMKSRNKDLVKLFEFGTGVHHAGMLRADRGLTERLFSDGLLKV